MKEDFTWAELGNRIRDRRIARGLSQQAVAEPAGITQAGLFRIEGGEVNPQLATLQKIAAVLECSVRELICGKSKPDPKDARILQRVTRVLESGDPALVQILESALVTAELVLERTGRRGAGLPPVVIKGEGRHSRANDLFWMRGSVPQTSREQSSVGSTQDAARKVVKKAEHGFGEHE